MLLTVLSFPIYVLAADCGGDYSETETVVYDGHAPVTVEVPTSADVPCRYGAYVWLGSFVTPDDPAVVTVAEAVRERAERGSLSPAYHALRWVQSNISYVEDIEAHGEEDWWQLPCETLRLGAGDCEDQSLLLVSILKALGYDAVLVIAPGHVGAAVLTGSTAGNVIEYDGELYQTAEPTGRSGLGGTEYDVIFIVPEGIGRDYVWLLAVDAVLMAMTAVALALVVFRWHRGYPAWRWSASWTAIPGASCAWTSRPRAWTPTSMAYCPWRSSTGRVT